MTPELKLILTAAGMLGLMVALLVWIIRDWVRERKKRKVREAWERCKIQEAVYWDDFYWLFLLPHREKRLARAKARMKWLRWQLTDEYWDNWWEEQWAKHHYPGRKYKRQPGRIDLDGYYDDCARSVTNE
jgi:hypothetical protein